MDVFNLQAKIGIDSKDYEKGLSNASSKFSSFADGLKSAAGKLGDILAGIGKAATVGIGAASTAMTAIVKQSLDQVGQYEQMVGGVEKLFGDAAGKVQKYAEEAFASAGLSANEYMETVTSFSASLIQSLSGDTMKAADLANTAIKDMSDNANVFGTDMASIQNAYQAFAKQNYTLLDNLKLGYGGTAREMARLLNESGVLGKDLINLDDTKGLSEAINKAGFSKIIEAINVIQQRLKITGTTADEASKTLEGSTRAVKAAWQNFLTGVGTPEQFAENLSISIGNIRNNLQTIIPRLTEGIETLFDLIAPEIPPIIEEMLPTIIDASSSLLSGLASRLPQLIKTILPALATGVVDVTTALVQSLPGIITSLKESIPIIVTTIMSKKDDLLKAGGELFDMIISPFKNPKEVVETATTFVSNLANKISDKKVLETIGVVAGDIVFSIAEGLSDPESAGKFLDAASRFVVGFADGLKNFLIGKDGEGGLMGGIEAIINSAAEWFENPQNRDEFEKASKEFIESLGISLLEVLNRVPDILLSVGRLLLDTLIGNIDYDSGADAFWTSLLESIWNSAKRFSLPFSGEDMHVQEMWQQYGGSMPYDEFKQKWYDAEGIAGALFGMSDKTRLSKMGIAYTDENGRSDAYTENLADIQRRQAEAEYEDVVRANRLWEQIQDIPLYADDVRNRDFGSAGERADYIESLLSSGRTSDWEARRLYKLAHPDEYVPGFAEGGIVTKPTLAWIGERGESEAVVPLGHETETSRALGLGGVTIQFGDIYVNGESGDVGQTVIQRLDEALRVWQLQQKRGVGSAAWQV